MRHKLIAARKASGKKQRETAVKVGISLRYYQKIEAGTNEGKGHIWDALEDLFQISQRELRENSTQQDCTRREA